ncbi:LysM peptidoglycan-binding domain-containing protein [Ferrimonas lipolytica]|uniref:LysM peptidoglycan-binding domain-containing protein n=1 Tax=Ferrimonas lipolytica TaxID=2724191 RepID=A0A6H1UGG0_9GAMM|nr:LysM domain-containing protein [Ferrimonas lipolytica]QIZ78195.1 LysM peptidoglycan-binding domain-containing protein [Ferrimonas lipolytica]
MNKLVVFLAAAITCCAWADTLTLKPGHPDAYVVKKGDTLWDISAMFLDDPWRWPTLWGANPQIANPHLIYPGDELTLVFIDGVPRLVRKGGKAKVRLSPGMNTTAKGGPVPPVPLSLIEPYLSFQQVISPEQLEGIPRVMGGERDAVGYVKNDVVFVHEELEIGARYGLYKKGRPLVDIDGKTLLGLEVELAATGQVIESGEISKVKLLNSRQEIVAGEYVMPITDASLLPSYFLPHPAPDEIHGNIIASNSKNTEIGVSQVAIVNKGSVDGVKEGQVYAIHRQGDQIAIDKNNENRPYREKEDLRAYDKVVTLLGDGRSVVLPKVYSGELMVFKAYDKVSLALIVNGRRPARLGNEIMAPVPMVLGTKRD